MTSTSLQQPQRQHDDDDDRGLVGAENRESRDQQHSCSPESPHFASAPLWSLDDFEFGRQIGEGRFGAVFLAREKSTGYKVAVKAVRKEDVVRLDMRHQLEREVRLQHYASRHPHVLRMFACFWDRKFVYLVTEYCEGGDLSHYRAAPPASASSSASMLLASSSSSSSAAATRGGAITFVDEATIACWTRQLLDAVAFLHERRLLHRDLKPENLLLKRGRLKLGDFTWCVSLQQEPPFNRRRTICGTLDYLSPELVSHLPYDTHLDVWSIACVVYELLVGSPPFEQPRPVDTCLSIQRGEFTIPPGAMSAEAEAFLRSMLVVEPSERPSCRALLEHPWIVAAPETPPPKMRSLLRRRGNSSTGGGATRAGPAAAASSAAPGHTSTGGASRSAAVMVTSMAGIAAGGEEDVSRALALDLSEIDPASVSRATDAGQ